LRFGGDIGSTPRRMGRGSERDTRDPRDPARKVATRKAATRNGPTD